MQVTPEIYHVEISTGEWLDGEVGSSEREGSFKKKQEKYKGISFMELSEYDSESKYSPELATPSSAVLSKDQICELAIAGISFQVKQKIIAKIDITSQLIEMAEKPIKIAMQEGGGDTYNNKCEVHMPGNMMAMYNEMLLLENACTDELQGSLNSGWRLVAACPQPDQRRPDYILGRFNPELQTNGTAERG
jgi:hypothetical protein